MTEPSPRAPGDASRRRIQFLRQADPDDTVLMRFADPFACVAVIAPAKHPQRETLGESLEVTVLPAAVSSIMTDAPQVYLKARGVELWWRPGQATLICKPEDTEPLLAALAEFAHYEGQLRRIEQEIADSWTDLDQDRALAFDVAPADLRRDETTAGRMARTLQRRERYARIEPHLYAPSSALAAAGQKLGEDLRERTRMEARAEAVDGQLEVFEHIYEMASQRLGEYRAARSGQIMEVIIIVLLSMETLLMLFQLLFKR